MSSFTLQKNEAVVMWPYVQGLDYGVTLETGHVPQVQDMGGGFTLETVVIWLQVEVLEGGVNLETVDIWTQIQCLGGDTKGIVDRCP